jgi:hypothetical protein
VGYEVSAGSLERAEKRLAEQVAGCTEGRNGSCDHYLLTHDWTEPHPLPQ